MEDSRLSEGEEKKELIHKIQTLNKHLEILLKRNERKELTEIRRQLNETHQKHVISLDYVQSNTLEEVEEGIRETVQGVVYSKVALCSSLANIVNKKLYLQAGAHNFFEYLKMERLPIKYKTAKEYAKIGDVLQRHSHELDKINFQEEDGLKKLIYLDKALTSHDTERSVVFHRMKEDSLRDFQRFAANKKDEKNNNEENGNTATIEEENAPPYFSVSGRSVVLTRGDYSKEAVLTVPEEGPFSHLPPEKFSLFMKELLELVTKFLQDGN
jgi:hypothetical protein